MLHRLQPDERQISREEPRQRRRQVIAAGRFRERRPRCHGYVATALLRLNLRCLVSPPHRTGRLLDILRGQGQRGLQAFMESLEFYHPEQYTQLTGEQPTHRCSLILGTTAA